MVALLVEQTKMTMLTMIKVMIMTTTIMKELKTFHKDVVRNCDFSVTLDEGNSSSPAGDQSSHSNASIEPQPCTSNEYKIVGDNIDENVRASFQRLNHQTKSLHYFHTFAVRDRVDFSGLSDVTPHYVKIDPATLLPGPVDLTALLKELQVIVSRCVCNCRYFIHI